MTAVSLTCSDIRLSRLWLLFAVAMILAAPRTGARADIRLDSAQESREKFLERRREMDREQQRKLEESDRLYAESARGFIEEHFPWALLVLFVVVLGATWILVCVREHARAEPETIILPAAEPLSKQNTFPSILGLFKPGRRRRHRHHRHHGSSHSAHRSHRHSARHHTHRT